MKFTVVMTGERPLETGIVEGAEVGLSMSTGRVAREHSPRRAGAFGALLRSYFRPPL